MQAPVSMRKIAMVGVPMDLGGGRRGVDMGPSAVRIAGLRAGVERLGFEFLDKGNIAVPQPESREPKNPRAHFLPEIAKSCRRLRGRVERILEEGAFPVVIGGDHSIAIGTVAAISSFHHRRGQSIGLLWFDAHGDMNTPESSPSGNIHGMPCAVCLGRGAPELVQLGERVPMVDPEKVCIVGVRDLDRAERQEIRDSGVRVLTMRDVDELGMSEVMRRALAVVTRGTAGFHLSFDMDGTDPSVAPGVGTPVPGGTDLRESHLVMELAAETKQLLGIEMTEINPILDERNRTAEVAVELVLSALGKRIL
jgi:arginase